MISKSLEQYLKTMYILKKQNGNIRVTDVAKKMNCTKPSVNKAIHNLGLDSEKAEVEAEKIKLAITDETINKLAKYVHKTLGLNSLDCGYDINKEKCRCCVRRTNKNKLYK